MKRQNTLEETEKRKKVEELGEDLYIDEEDRKRLEALSDKERNEILLERHLKLSNCISKVELEKKISAVENRSSIKEEPMNTEEKISKFCEMVFKRDFLVKNCYKPFFKLFIGHYVRTRIGDIYYAAKIVGIREANEFTLDVGSKSFKTNIALDIEFKGNLKTGVSLTFLSNGPVSFSESRAVVESGNYDFKKHQYGYKNVVKKMETHLTDEELELAQKERRRFFSSYKKNVLRKIELIRERTEAMEKFDNEKAKMIQRQIDKIDEEEDKKKLKDPFLELAIKNKKLNMPVSENNDESISKL